MNATASNARPAVARRLLPVARGIGEVVLFAFSLFMAIPAVPSSPDEVYTATSAMCIGGPAFIAFLLLSRIRPWVAVWLLLVYLVFVWGVNQRVFLGS